MKIGLINPPYHYEPNPVNHDLICLNGIGNIGAELKRAGHEVKTCDYVHNPNASLDEVADCRVVGITSNINCYDFLRQNLRELKKQGKITVVGGPLISSYGSSGRNLLVNLLPKLDYGIIGEGDIAVVELARYIEGGGKIPQGVISRHGGFVPNRGKSVEKLDDLAEVDYNDWPNLRDAARGKAFNLVLSRGCYNSCSFCFKLDRNVRSFSLNRAKSEIQRAVELKPRLIDYGDDVFTYDKERAIAIAEFSKGLGLDYVIASRTNDLDDDLLKVLKDTGCLQVQVGVESFDDEVLKRAGKNQTAADIYSCIDRTQKAGIRFSGFILIGLPGETRESLKKTVDGVRNTGIRARARLVMPLPGTRIYKMAVEKGLVDEVKMLEMYSRPECFDSTRGSWVPINLSEVSDEELLAARDEIIEINKSRFGEK